MATLPLLPSVTGLALKQSPLSSDAARRALAGAVVHFGKEQRCEIIAEGVETAAELGALKALGVARMQGYFLRRPGPLASTAALCERQQQRSIHAAEAAA